MAKKTKAFNESETFPERDILETKLDTLKEIQSMLNATGPDGSGFDTIESTRKRAETWRAIMLVKGQKSRPAPSYDHPQHRGAAVGYASLRLAINDKTTGLIRLAHNWDSNRLDSWNVM